MLIPRYMEAPESPMPKNATDRNVGTATGMWQGHITLPSSFLTTLLLIINLCYLLIIHWNMNQQEQMRDRIRIQEQLILEAVKKMPNAKLATPTPDTTQNQPRENP